MDLTGLNPKTNAVVIIPSRFDSTRLPGKALLDIAGKPMICHVLSQALAAKSVNRVIVATDDQRILEVVQQTGYEAMMTSPHHTSGTDRIAEVAEKLPEFDIVVNLQGDEPLISPQTIDRVIEALRSTPEAGVATTWEPINSSFEVLSPDVVKIVVGENGRVLAFSRSPIPFPREAARTHGSLEAALKAEPSLLKIFRKHTGLYVYRREVLLEFAHWPQTQTESIEALEQLRALEHGVKMIAVEAASQAIGVDTPEDLERVRKLMTAQMVQQSG